MRCERQGCCPSPLFRAYARSGCKHFANKRVSTNWYRTHIMTRSTGESAYRTGLNRLVGTLRTPLFELQNRLRGGNRRPGWVRLPCASARNEHEPGTIRLALRVSDSRTDSPASRGDPARTPRKRRRRAARCSQARARGARREPGHRFRPRSGHYEEPRSVRPPICRCARPAPVLA